MTKRTRKLNLRKETLSTLTGNSLRRARGGGIAVAPSLMAASCLEGRGGRQRVSGSDFTLTDDISGGIVEITM